MSRVIDTLGQVVAEGGLWVTLRQDSPGGVSLGGSETIEPGETKLLPAHLALGLLQTERAFRATPPEKSEPVPVPELTPVVADTAVAAPLVATTAKPPKRGKR